LWQSLVELPLQALFTTPSGCSVDASRFRAAIAIAHDRKLLFAVEVVFWGLFVGADPNGGPGDIAISAVGVFERDLGVP
jgi:hypothetical protein